MVSMSSFTETQMAELFMHNALAVISLSIKCDLVLADILLLLGLSR
jgi:hypothetical protein